LNGNAFKNAAEGKSGGFASEMLYFLSHNKRWWLTPIVIAMFLLSILIFMGGTGAAPFIYTLF
jgi:hypothetical protein